MANKIVNASTLLHKWKTICVVDTWYVLTDESRDEIEWSYLSRSQGSTILMEKATGREETGTGEKESVPVGNFFPALDSYLRKS